MSVKASKTEKKKPRAMPVETIVTRFKSAQQKQKQQEQKQQEQLQETKTTKRQKNTKSKNVQSIKSTESKTVRQKKVQKKIIKTPDKPIVTNDKVEEVEVVNKEYYPDKLKRKVLNAKVFLAPKHSFKVVCGMKNLNKRKLHIPQRDAEYSQVETKQHNQDVKISKQKHQEISIVDMVRLIEENDSLDDDDLLEILTCPSPVWWEESPDGCLDEPLYSQCKISDKEIIKIDTKEATIVETESNNNTNIVKPLSINVNIENKDKSFINKRCKLENLLGNIKNKTKPLIEEETQENVPDDKVTHISKKRKIEKEKSKENLNSSFEDFLEFHDDESLKHLENINIPTELSVKKEDLSVKKEELALEQSKSRRESCSIDDMTEEYLDLSLLDDDDILNDDTQNDDTQNDDSQNDDSQNDDTQNDATQNDDTQNDYTLSDDTQNDEIIINSSPTFIDDSNNVSKDNELVTVYKILNSDDDVDKKDGKINSFYKCKKNKLKSLDNIDRNSQLTKDSLCNSCDTENRSIVISESEKVKYCLVCSSIFNTNKCNYCLRMNLKRKMS